MKTENNIENNLDEVIFEKRNKEYGAYFLRKTYEKNVTHALTITITLVLLVVAIPLIANYLKDDPLFRKTTHTGPEIIVLTPPKEEIKEIPPLPPIKDIPVRLKLKEFIIIDDTNVKVEIPTQDNLNNQGNNEPIADVVAIKVDPNQKDKEVIEDDPGKVVDFSGVAEKPVFIGGEDGLFKFIIDNIKYPDLARENKIQGTVYIEFVVEQDGSITNIKVKNGIGAGCDEEAERVVKLMPKWTPGKQNNRGVRVRVVIPMRFMIVE